MSNERNEADILAQAPVTLKFAGKDYDVPVRRILKAREWRNNLTKEIGEITKALAGDGGIAENVMLGLAAAFTKFPEKIADLVFDYAGDALPRQTIEENATEEELALAFSKIMGVAFPFTRQMALVQTVLSTAANLSR